jgi:hypothetical protein
VSVCWVSKCRMSCMLNVVFLFLCWVLCAECNLTFIVMLRVLFLSLCCEPFFLLCCMPFYIVMLSVVFNCYARDVLFVTLSVVFLLSSRVSCFLLLFWESRFYRYSVCHVFIVMLRVLFLWLCCVTCFYCCAECHAFVIILNVVFLL